MNQILSKIDLEKEIEGVSKMIDGLQKSLKLLETLKHDGFCTKTQLLESGFTMVVLVEDSENPMVTDDSTISRVEDLDIKNIYEIYRPVFNTKLNSPVLPVRGK